MTPSSPGISLKTTTMATGITPAPPPAFILLISLPLESFPWLALNPIPILVMGMMILSPISIGSPMIFLVERTPRSSSTAALMASVPVIYISINKIVYIIFTSSAAYAVQEHFIKC